MTIELAALILELPTPPRLHPGKLRAVSASRCTVVRDQRRLIGVIDFGRKEAFVLAVLVDSKIAGFPLTRRRGPVAPATSRVRFAFGGVNAAYEARLPADSPSLERLSVPLTREQPQAPPRVATSR